MGLFTGKDLDGPCFLGDYPAIGGTPFCGAPPVQVLNDPQTVFRWFTVFDRLRDNAAGGPALERLVDVKAVGGFLVLVVSER